MNLRNEKYSLLTHNELLNDELLNIETPIQEMYPEKANKQIKLLNIDVNKSYSLTSYILFFFTFSFVGYVYEVIVFLITNGKFVNRGIMYGPWLPIYGCGGVLIVFLLKRFRKSPFKMFIASCVLCGILEYGTAWFLETFKHIKYWDYTGHFMNLQGRICLECLILFGLGGCCFSYIISPILDNFYNKLRGNLKKILCMILIFAFFIDGSYVVMVKPNSGEGITIEAKVNEKINDYYVV